MRLAVYPSISRVLYIPGGCLGFLNHQQYPTACIWVMSWIYSPTSNSHKWRYIMTDDYIKVLGGVGRWNVYHESLRITACSREMQLFLHNPPLIQQKLFPFRTRFANVRFFLAKNKSSPIIQSTFSIMPTQMPFQKKTKQKNQKRKKKIKKKKNIHQNLQPFFLNITLTSPGPGPSKCETLGSQKKYRNWWLNSAGGPIF